MEILWFVLCVLDLFRLRMKRYRTRYSNKILIFQLLGGHVSRRRRQTKHGRTGDLSIRSHNLNMGIELVHEIVSSCPPFRRWLIPTLRTSLALEQLDPFHSCYTSPCSFRENAKITIAECDRKTQLFRPLK